MNKSVLLLTVAAALAAAAFFALGGDDASSESPQGVGLEDDFARSQPQRSGPGSGPGAAELGSVEAQEESVAREAATSAVATPSVTMESTPAPEIAQDDRGTGTLTGRVTDANGGPVSGAVIELERRDLEDLFFAESGEESGPKTPRAESDEDGRFSLTAASGNVRLFIEADRFAPYVSSAAITRDGDRDLGEIRLSEGVLLSGRVLDADGNGVQGAKLVREPDRADGITLLGRDQDVAAVTDAGGSFALMRQAAGPFQFTVSHPSHPSAQLQGETQRPGESLSGLEVTLEDGILLRGLVKGLTAEREGVFVTALSGPESSEFFRLPSASDPERTATVQSDGSFELRGLKPSAEYQVFLQVGRGSTPWGRARRSQATSVTTPKEGLGPAVQLVYSEGATVSFVVADSEGQPVAPDSVEAGFEYEMDVPDAVKNAGEGRCEVPSLWPQSGGEELILRVTKKGFEPWVAQGLMVYPDERVDLGVLNLVPRPSVEVTVVDDVTGEPVAGARVTMGPVTEESDSRSVSFSFSSAEDGPGEAAEPTFDGSVPQFGETDELGIVSLDATAGARVQLRVVEGVYATAQIGPIQLPASMEVFEQEVRLTVGGGLRVVALDPSGAPAQGYSVQLEGDDVETAAMRSERTGADGVLELEGLAAGPQRVRLGQRSGRSTMVLPDLDLGGAQDGEDDETWTDVTVLAGEVVEVVLAAPAIGSLKGEVAELGRELSGAEIKLSKAGETNPLAGMALFGGPGSPSATTDARGEFQIVDIEAGDYELTVEHATRAMPHTQEITIEGGSQEIQLDLSVTEVAGTVLDAAGEPLAGARVEAERVREETGPQRAVFSMAVVTDGGSGGVVMSMGDEEGKPTTTDAEGRFRLRGVTPGVQIAVKATAEGYDAAESEPFTVAEGSTESGVEVRFAEAGSIRIEVEGLSGRVLATLRRAGASPLEPPKVQMLDSESTTIDSLAPGSWTIGLRGLGTELKIDPKEREVTVTAGEEAVAAFELL